uniref:Methyltransf_21 domain-containing protein n=1 Tax=Caenorhabditis tropicalis TaxID=1561998 RepID=A0A1I7TBX2_9PELO
MDFEYKILCCHVAVDVAILCSLELIVIVATYLTGFKHPLMTCQSFNVSILERYNEPTVLSQHKICTTNGPLVFWIIIHLFTDLMALRPRIDILWMDTEGNEFPVLDMIHRGGPLDRRGVKICQMNVEIHKDLMKDITGEREKFHDFVWKLLADKKYIMVKPFYVYWFHQFIRTVIINVDDPECTGLYMN